MKIYISVVSWVISPIICGVVATLLYMFVRFFVMNRKNPFNASLQVLPFFYFITVAINVYAIVYGGSKCKIQKSVCCINPGRGYLACMPENYSSTKFAEPITA